MKRLVATFILAFLPIQALAADYPASFVGITDGDTITVLKADKSHKSSPIKLTKTTSGRVSDLRVTGRSGP